jgi:hypothetical protein
VSLTQATSKQTPSTSISGSNSYRFRQFPNPVPTPDLAEPNKKVRKYRRPEHQQADFAAKIKGQSGAKYEQDEAKQRFSLLPPADKQCRPDRYEDTGHHRTEDSAKVQNASADMLNRANWKRWITDL